MKFSKSMFDRLADNVKKMGAKPQGYALPEAYPGSSKLESELEKKTGIEINLDDLEETNGLLSIKGLQVVVFMPKHSPKIFDIERVIAGSSSGNKFHIADCEKLKEMRGRNRFDGHYIATIDLSGDFFVRGIARESSETIEGTARLNVCKLCLKMLNYEGAATAKWVPKEIVRRFSLEKFFSIYSSEFESLPKRHIEHAQKGYTDDWADLSKKLRSKSGYRCQHCSVRLTDKLIDNRGLLHVHHINEDKLDNSPENLIVLCADCHRKEHVHMGISRKNMLLINDCRAEQGILDNINTWEDVKKYADPALSGLIDFCEKTNESIPRVHYKVCDDDKNVITVVDLAWLDEKEGVYIGDKPALLDWTLLSLQEAIEKYRGKWEE